MNKKVRIYNPQYAQGGITQQDIQNYLMAQQQQQQPQITEDMLVDTIYNELTLLGDKAGYVDQGYIDDLADKITESYGVDNNYAVNLVNEVYATLAPSDLEYQKVQMAQVNPAQELNMGEEQGEYQDDLTEENLEENVSTYDDYYGDDTGMSEMKFGGMSRKKFMTDFIRKAQEGMEQEADPSVMGNNDIMDGRNALVKGFESSMKKAVVKAVAKNQFEKMQEQQNSYFAEGGFYDPNNLGDQEAYAHHLNLMAAANKDIFNQPQMTMARDGREQRRANRDQRRVGRDVQKVLNNLPGLYPGGFNVYSMPGQMMPDMGQLGQGMPPFTIEGERNIFGGLKSYKASFQGGLPVNFMAGMMMPGRRGRGLNMLSSMYGYPSSFYSQQNYSNPGQIIYETVNKESLKEVDQNTPGNTSTEVKEGQGSTVPGTSATIPVVPGAGQTVVPPIVPQRVTVPPVVPPVVVPEYETEIDRRKFKDDLVEIKRPGKNYKEWPIKGGGKGVSYEGTYTTGMFGTKRPARYQVVYKSDGTIDKKKSFVAVSQSDYGGTIYVPWDKQGSFWYEDGGAVMNANANPFGELQKYVYGGYDPSVAELDGTNLVDPSDPYTRKFAPGGTQEEYQSYIDWYNEDAPEEGMRKAAPQSYEEWMAENYPEEVTVNKPKQNIVPGYNPQNAALAAQYMTQAMGYNMPRTPFGSFAQAASPFSISRGMVQKGLPMIAGTNIPFTGAFGPDTRISEIYTEPRRFGKDAIHYKFMVPGQEGPMLGMDWQQQVQQQQQQQQGPPEGMSKRDMRKEVMDTYDRYNLKGFEDETKVDVRAGERGARRNARRLLRQDPNAFYEGEALDGMTAPMSDEEYMAKVQANKAKAPASTPAPTPTPKATPKATEEKKESQYKSKRAALYAALDGASRKEVKNLGKDYIGLDQISKNAKEQRRLFDEMSKDQTLEGLEKANKYATDVVIPGSNQVLAKLKSVKDYQANTSKKDKRKNFREFKKEARNRAEGGFVPDYMAYGGTPMYPNGGFVYSNPVDNRTNPVMSDQSFFEVNSNNNNIPDYLEWQSTPNQEVDVTYKQKNKINFQPKGLMPFIGNAARNTRGALEGSMIDQFNNQNMMTSSGRVAPTEMLSQGRYDINTGREIESGFEGIIGAGLTQQTYSKFGGQLDYEEGGEYDLTEEEIQALIDAGVDITLLEDYED